MSSSRFMTPPINISTARDPVTPDSGLRARGMTPRLGENGNGNTGDSSPTSSTMSNGSRIVEPSRSLYRHLSSTPSSAQATPGRRVTIRADPALFTCFDSADRELYDLWAPKP